MKKQYFITLLLLLVLAPQQGMTEEREAYDTIKAAVEQFVMEQTQHLDRENMELNIGRLDPRLKLTKCDEPLETFSISKFNPAGKNNIGVRCHSPAPWKVYVSANIKYFADVAVTAAPLSRGEIISIDQIVMEKKDVSRLSGGYFTDPKEVIGKEVKQYLRIGTNLSPRYLTNPKIIKKGQLVTIKSGNQRISVTTSGKALSDGAMGDIIQVINEKSKRVIEGKVTAPGTVEIHI